MQSPKALLSDFGTSEEMLKGKRERTGHTGTMAYMVRSLTWASLRGRLQKHLSRTWMATGDLQTRTLICGLWVSTRSSQD